jgi:iron complex outermembrane recepter protein
VLHSQFDFREHTTLDVSARYVGRIGNLDLPHYLGIDVRVGWRPIEQLEVAVTGRNLLDGSHPEFGLPAIRREIERSYNGSVTWRF